MNIHIVYGRFSLLASSMRRTEIRGPHGPGPQLRIGRSMTGSRMGPGLRQAVSPKKINCCSSNFVLKYLASARLNTSEFGTLL